MDAKWFFVVGPQIEFGLHGNTLNPLGVVTHFSDPGRLWKAISFFKISVTIAPGGQEATFRVVYGLQKVFAGTCMATDG